jgi:hypothetical protein
VKDKTYTNNIDVPGAVANINPNNHGPEDGQNNSMAGKTGAKDNYQEARRDCHCLGGGGGYN